MKILFTGGNGQFARAIKAENHKLNILFPGRDKLNMVDKDSIREYAFKTQEIDILITGAYQYPESIERLNLDSFSIFTNHLYFIEQIGKKCKYFINLTTGLKVLDEHYLYRAQKTFAENLYHRYFSLKENSHIKFLNLHPNHLDDKKIRTRSAQKLIDLLNSIESLKDTKENSLML